MRGGGEYSLAPTVVAVPYCTYPQLPAQLTDSQPRALENSATATAFCLHLYTLMDCSPWLVPDTCVPDRDLYSSQGLYLPQGHELITPKVWLSWDRPAPKWTVHCGTVLTKASQTGHGYWSVSGKFILLAVKLTAGKTFYKKWTNSSNLRMIGLDLYIKTTADFPGGNFRSARSIFVRCIGFEFASQLRLRRCRGEDFPFLSPPPPPFPGGAISAPGKAERGTCRPWQITPFRITQVTTKACF